MRKLLESTEIKLQPPTQDYLEWLGHTSESSFRATEAEKKQTNVLDVIGVSTANVAWAVNMAINLEKNLQEYQKNTSSGKEGDKLKLLSSALGLARSLASGLWSVRDVVKKLGVSNLKQPQQP